MLPFGIYDTKACSMVHIGLYESADDCWRIFLGWPTFGEVNDAKARGLVCLSLTCTYDPRKPLC